MLIALEGLPGAGKTTSARLLGERLSRRIVCETTHDHPFLTSVYDDDARHDLQVELAFLLLHSSAYREIADQAVVTDFSPVKDRLFAEDMLSGEDRRLFEEVYSRLYAGLSVPSVVLFLDASPELCMDRVERRLTRDEHRLFEEGLELDRLKRMHERYESKLEDLGRRVVRVSVSQEDSEDDVVARLIAALDE